MYKPLLLLLALLLDLAVLHDHFLLGLALLMLSCIRLGGLLTGLGVWELLPFDHRHYRPPFGIGNGLTFGLAGLAQRGLSTSLSAGVVGFVGTRFGYKPEDATLASGPLA